MSWTGESEKIIKRCYHCGEEINKTQSLCQFCNLKEKRIEMHEENKKVFGINWVCEICTAILGKTA